MSVSLLAPLFLAGLIAVAVPILVHLTNRDRKDVVRFPSLKFLTRLPYRQVRRQRIQHWLLFALRTLAIVLLVAAFTRPLINGTVVGLANDDPGREVVIALDRSYSMAYGDTWERALEVAWRTGAPEYLEQRLVHLLRYRRGLAKLRPDSLWSGSAHDAARILREIVTGDTLGPGLIFVLRELTAGGAGPTRGLSGISWLPSLLE